LGSVGVLFLRGIACAASQTRPDFASLSVAHRAELVLVFEKDFGENG